MAFAGEGLGCSSVVREQFAIAVQAIDSEYHAPTRLFAFLFVAALRECERTVWHYKVPLFRFRVRAVGR
jgi:hypothetical protein